MTDLTGLTAIWLYRVREPGDALSSGFAPGITTLPTRGCPLCGDGTDGTVPVADAEPPDLHWLCLTHAARSSIPMLTRGRDVVQEWEAMAK